MTSDDFLAWMASRPKSERPTELKSDSEMLFVWLKLRDDRDFRNDVICRHGLSEQKNIDPEDQMHQHCIGNAWGHAVQVYLERRKPKW